MKESKIEIFLKWWTMFKDILLELINSYEGWSE